MLPTATGIGRGYHSMLTMESLPPYQTNHPRARCPIMQSRLRDYRRDASVDKVHTWKVSPRDQSGAGDVGESPSLHSGV